MLAKVRSFRWGALVEVGSSRCAYLGRLVQVDSSRWARLGGLL